MINAGKLYKKEEKRAENVNRVLMKEDASTVLSFCNHFWGKEERGVNVLFNRMDDAKAICEEVRSFYKDWATIEEEYARRLQRLVRGTLGSREIGTLRESLSTLQRETEAIAKQHSNIALQIRGELEEPLHTFYSDMRANRKTIQSNLEKLRRIKTAQEQQVQKCKEKIEDKNGKIGGHGSQLGLFLGKNSDKNNLKADKTQIMAQNNNDYLLAITVLQETSIKWIREWKIACDKFQDLEERRLNIIKSSLWSFSGIISETCISDSKSCEKIRSSIEKCNIQNDIQLFIRTNATGQEIPNPPKDQSNGLDDLNEPAYSIAQFSRVSDPQFHSDAIMQRSILNQNSVCLSPKVSSFFSETQSDQPSKNDTNDVPLDGMTHFCKNDSSISNSLNAKSSSSVTSTYAHNTGTHGIFSLFGYKDNKKEPSAIPGAKGKDGYSFNMNDKRSDLTSSLDEPSYVAVNGVSKVTGRSTSPVKNFSSKKSLETTNSPLLERLRDMGVVSDSEIEPIDPRANVMLNVGNNTFEVDSNVKKQKPELRDPEDPIVAALTQLKVSSKASPSLKKEPTKISWVDPIDKNGIQNSEVVNKKQYFPPEHPHKQHPNLRPPIPIPQKPNLSNKFMKQDTLNAPPSAITSARMKHISQAYAKQVNDIYSTSEKNLYPSQYDMMPINNRNCYDQFQENVYAEKEALPMAREKTQNGIPRMEENLRSPMTSEKYSYMDSRPVLRPPSPQLQYRTISPEHNYPRSRSRSPIVYKTVSPGSPYPSRAEKSMVSSQNNRMHRSLTPAPYAGDSPHLYRRVSRQQAPSSIFDIALDANGNLINKYSRARSASPCPTGHRFIPENGYNYNVHMDYQPYNNTVPGEYRDYYREDARAFNYASLYNDRREYMNNSSIPSQYTEDGKKILFYVRALFDYQATVPEEISFVKGDILLVLEMQEDGWWEGEVVNSKNPKRGLFPSNFVQHTTNISQ